MAEINLLDKYPRSQRPIEARGKRKLAGAGWLGERGDQRDNMDIQVEYRLLEIARNFGKEYFDADRLYGYGGYYYNPRFWTDTALRFRDYYSLGAKSSVLDVGCAKGFLMYDLLKLVPGLSINGLDISQYACDNAPNDVRSSIKVGNAKALPYADKSFDFVISINTVDHLPLDECKLAITEIVRVAKRNAFISVNAWRNEKERERLLKWNLTAQTSMHVDDWKEVFTEIGYEYDYWWFIAE